MITPQSLMLIQIGTMARLSIYAGIGSRETPIPIQNVMTKFATAVSKTHVLRSGGATGADDAFYQGAKTGCDKHKLKYKNHIEIFLPWDGFEGFYTEKHDFVYLASLASHMIAEKYHPKYNKLTDAGKSLMARNSQQILGRLLTNRVDFVVCYTSDGKASGGTGQAIRIAEDKGIPVYNLFYQEAFHFCKEFIDLENN